MPIRWVEPKLVCSVEFQEWTKDGILRGAWKRVTTARNVSLVVRPFRVLNRQELDALDRAVARFTRFVQMPTTLTVE